MTDSKNQKKPDFKEVYTFRAEPKIMEKVRLFAKLNEVSTSNIIRNALLSHEPLKKYFT